MEELAKRMFSTHKIPVSYTHLDNAYQILMWNDAAHQDQENKRYYDHEVVPCTTGRLQVSISGLAPGNYLLRGYSVGYQKNDAYTMYLRMKKQGSLSLSLIHILYPKRIYHSVGAYECGIKTENSGIVCLADPD